MKMDPDAALQSIRETIESYRCGEQMENNYQRDASASELVDLVTGLDNWLKRGGYLPAAWQPQQEAVR